MVNIEIDKLAIYASIKKLTNQIYKLLPNREEDIDWQTPLSTVIEELSGMSRLLENHEILFDDAKNAVKEVVKTKMRLFGSNNKA